METGLAMADLDGGDKPARLAAIEVLSHRLLPDVLNRLKALVAKAPDGSFVEPDADVRAAAGAAVDRIEQARSIYSGPKRCSSASASARCWCSSPSASPSPSA
jgi:urea transport system permease protein